MYFVITVLRIAKKVTMGGGGQKCPKLRDVIYGRPHSSLIILRSLKHYVFRS
jgi:hypothetical protein